MANLDHIPAEQRERIVACFNEDTEKECAYCPAFHEFGGECCFGVGFDPKDYKDCLRCKFKLACKREVEDPRPNMRYTGNRIPVTRGERTSTSNFTRHRQAPAPTGRSRVDMNWIVNKPGPPIDRHHRGDEFNGEEIPYLQELFVDMLWKGATGIIAVLFEFFANGDPFALRRRRKWRPSDPR